jgi:cysteine desulfurase
MIYLDYNATTPIDGRVAQAVQPYLYQIFGNPSSSHDLGIIAKEAVEEARKKVAALINCSPEELVFTSGGSESNNTVIKGVAHTYRNKGNHIITSQIEHPATLAPLKFMEETGYQVTYLPVDEYGLVSVTDLEKAITDKTILITIMHSNNETGTIQYIEEIGKLSKKYNILFHTDASQSLGKVPIDINKLEVDFLTIAGHKLYAPKGIGALYIRKGIKIEPLIHGAGHESGRRAGTENIVLDVALGEACDIAKKSFNRDKKDILTRSTKEIADLTSYLYNRLLNSFGDKIKLNGHPTRKLPNTLNISFLGFNGFELLEKLEDIALSTGSACHSGLTSMSPVLKAMGVSEEIGRGAVRFSLGRYTTKTEIDMVVEKLKAVTGR